MTNISFTFLRNHVSLWTSASILFFLPTSIHAHEDPIVASSNSHTHWLWIVAGVAFVIIGITLYASNLRLKRMRDELKLSHSNLEQRVHERTLELENEIIQRNRIENALSESEAQVRAVVDNVLDGIITINTNGIIQSFNHAAERVFGYYAYEVIGKDISMLMPKSYGKHHNDYIKNYHDTGDAKIIGTGREVEGLRKDGSTFPLELAVNEIWIEEERIYCGIVRDITDQKESAIALVQAKEEAEVANKAKSEFLSSMSHELRTPMNAILGFSQLLEMEDISESQKEVVHEIIKAGRHLLQLINEILDLSKVESGNIDLSIEPVDLKEIFNECVSLIKPLASERRVKLHFQQPLAEAPTLRADRIRLKQVILNLLSNAIKYNRKNGMVNVAFLPGEENFVRVNITDTGSGITNSRQEELFQSFNRIGAEHSDVDGSGIGLVISKHLLELMGGRIGVESEEGKGSTFWFELPREAPIESGLATAQGNEEFVLSDNHEHHTIIYIEDNPANLKLVSQLFAHRSALSLYTAHTAEIGLRLTLTHKPDIILLDINLPGISGYDVLAQLKQMPEMADIPVVAISANAMPEDIQKGLESGFIDYLTKPLDVPRFFQVIDSLLAQTKHND
jgi:PAS domain S-box-containing protein